jgi:hypothetical protein
MNLYMVEVRDAAGEWWTIGREPFEADTAEAAIILYREQSGDTETPDERIRALPPVDAIEESGGL